MLADARLHVSQGILSRVVGFHIARARARTLSMFLHHIGERMNLRPVEYSLLMLLRENDTLTPKQLSGALSLSAPMLTQLLDRLEERGHVDRVRNAADRRSQLVRLSHAGRQFVDELARLTPSMEADLSRSLSDAERAMLIELLQKVANHPSSPSAAPREP